MPCHRGAGNLQRAQLLPWTTYESVSPKHPNSQTCWSFSPIVPNG